MGNGVIYWYRGLKKRPLLVVLLLFAGLSYFYHWSVPPFEGPDEPEHFAYAVWLAEGKGFPPQREAAWDTPVRQEAGQPPLYYWLASLSVRLVDHNEPAAVFRPNPHFPSSAPGHVPDNKNIAIHYPSDNVLQGGWLALRLARGVSFLFGLLLILCVYRLAQVLFPQSGFIPFASALLTAVIPQVLFISNVVSNDIPAAAAGALTLWLLVRLLKGEPSVAGGLALGLAFGLSSLSKTGNLALALPVTAAFVWLWRREKKQHGNVRRTALAAAVGAVLVGGWWYLRAWILYGSPFGLNAHYLAPWALAADSAPLDLLAQWREVFFSFWAAFGWGNVKFPGWVYYPLAALLLLAVIGVILRGRRSWRHVPPWLYVPLLTIVAVVLALAWWMQRVTAPHGRLLFPALAAFVLLFIVGWNQIHRRLAYAAVFYLSVLALLSLVLLIRPAYTWPEFLSEAALPSGETAKLNWRFGDFARLVSVTPVEKSAAAGETLPVAVCWYTLGQAEEDYTVLVQLVGPENQVVGGRRTYPGLGSYPTSTWEAGRQFCDEVGVDIPADLALTLQYQIEVGFISQEGERVTAVNDDGSVRDHLFASAVRLETAEPPQLVQTPAGEDPIRLVMADFNSEWRIGASEAVTLQWWLAEPVSQDYTVFVHLRDGNQNVAQGDGQPVKGWYPTSLWEKDEVVEDVHEVMVTADIAPGSYDLVVGWYDPVTGERLGSEVLLGPVEVVP